MRGCLKVRERPFRIQHGIWLFKPKVCSTKSPLPAPLAHTIQISASNLGTVLMLLSCSAQLCRISNLLFSDLSPKGVVVELNYNEHNTTNGQYFSLNYVIDFHKQNNDHIVYLMSGVMSTLMNQSVNILEYRLVW